MSLPGTQLHHKSLGPGPGSHNPFPSLFQPHCLLHVPSLVTASNFIIDLPLIPNPSVSTCWLSSHQVLQTGLLTAIFQTKLREDPSACSQLSLVSESSQPELPPEPKLCCALLWRNSFDKPSHHQRERNTRSSPNVSQHPTSEAFLQDIPEQDFTVTYHPAASKVFSKNQT